MSKSTPVESLAVNTIRTLAIDAVQKANSGHPGLPLGAAPMAYALWQNHLRFDPTDPAWPNRDRFVLSPGHGSMLLYSLLHLYGYDLSMDDLKAFRQWGSKTPGHPESFLTAGVEATTGPLGQGAANAVGMALAERALAHQFNRPGFDVVDHRTYALVSEGDLMEGLASEAAAIAGHLGLAKLTYLYDANDVTLDGPASLAFSEDISQRYESCGWHVQQIDDGDHDINGISRALGAAKSESDRPSLIVVKTTIGFGSPNKAGTSAAHGSPLGVDEIKLTKTELGCDPERAFYVADEAAAHFASRVEAGKSARATWNELFAAYAAEHAELAASWKKAQAGELPDGWDDALPTWSAGESLATRKASGATLNALAAAVPWLLGGDADLSVSTNTALKDAGSFDGKTGAGRNIHYGVREHAMGAIANGIAYHGGLRSFTATFFIFSDYMRPAVRLAAMNELPVIYVWTHDSIGLGEDGPTHQPVEHLASLRAIPNLTIIRPADAAETRAAWRFAMQHNDGPVGLVLSRQDLEVLPQTIAAANTNTKDGVARGAYVIADAEGGDAQVILIGTGAELHLALAAQKLLATDGIRTRVVSMPCWEAFAAQDQAYRDSVLPPAIEARVSVEAGVTFGWERWIGSRGVAIGVDTFGASAPGPKLFEEYGLTPTHVATAARSLL